VYSMIVSRLDRLTERSKVASRNVLDLLFDFILLILYSYCSLHCSIPASITTYLTSVEGIEGIEDDFRTSDLPLGRSSNSK
jgi:hypothetical protein